tara:strand:+ start:82 stop:228 length:147 start_codon:yes stop_codon:yes gene_type:complete
LRAQELQVAPVNAVRAVVVVYMSMVLLVAAGRSFVVAVGVVPEPAPAP